MAAFNDRSRGSPKKSNLLSLMLINQSRRGQGAKRSTHMPVSVAAAGRQSNER